MEEKKCPILPTNDAVQNWFEENIDKECSASSAIYKFRLWLESLQRKAITGAVWVKASERLPVNGGVDNKVIVRGILNEQGYTNHRFVAYGFRNFSPVKQEMYFEYGSKSFLTNDVEWLDESGTAAIEWDSIRLISRVKERFKELEEKQHDWRSFYIGWLEGRVDMLQQTKGYGRLSQQRADLIREANNRDLEGVAGIKQINRAWICDTLIEFTISYNRSANKDIANDAAEYLSDKLNEAGIEYVLSEDERTAAGREEDWISVYDQLPEEGGRYWCYVQQLTDLGYSYFQWNCDYNPQLRRFSDMTLKGGHEITHWRPQPEPPKFKQKEK